MFHTQRDLCIHFVGIGGIGMSGIAEVLLNLGYRVTGSDLKPSDITERLQALGGRVAIGHAAEHVGAADVVVVSSAVRPTNPEVLEARRRGIPVIPRAEMLGELMRMKYGVAVAGSHGKTTTTSLVATVLAHAGLDPTAVIGGKLNSLGSNARLGQGEFLVAEADESDGSFLRLTPTVAVVTNIDPEHLDHFGTVEALERAFLDFINKVPFYGLAVLCLDHPRVRALVTGTAGGQVEKRLVTYGLGAEADYRATDVRFDGLRSHFTAVARGRVLGEVTLAMPGLHNVQNALAVLAVAEFLGVRFEVFREALAQFQGVGRRFTVRGEVAGVMVIDDYGHHPAEIRATLAAARSGIAAAGRRVVVAFQPHRYTRTRDLLQEFAAAFDEAEVVVLTDIYAAGEEPIPGVTGETLAEAVRGHGHPEVRYVRRAEVGAALGPLLRRGDLLITLGAGDIWQVGDEVLAALATRERAGLG
ncbi:MAG TPA: UDP-N-acetylmuramate--L-alanine ligase [Polyangia bacterium]|jgi:UDP-N-acetylmuramate--alanine ligase|nr:UDP-N-acetylmuramate--L-alanine ligase [Polyangia bacterium]